MRFINTRAQSLTQGAIRAMFDRANTMTNVISMGIGEPDMTTPQLICKACEEALAKGLTHYTPNAGSPMLRRAIAEKSYLREVHYDPMREIIVTNGGMGALSQLFLVILEEGDEVLIQDPQWLNHTAQVSYCGGTAIYVPTDLEHQFEMQPEDIEARITSKTKAILINSPNNPTGNVISPAALEKVAKIAKEHDLLVVSDEVYNTLLYGDRPYLSIAALDGMKERTVVVNSFSKSYAMTGWRIGFATGPEEIVDRMTKCQENFNSCANSIGQYAAAIALEHPDLCHELRDVFAKRREILLKGLADIPGMRCNNPTGAFYVFADIRGFGLSSKEFCNKLLSDARVVCIPGSAFGNCGEGFIRIAYTCNENDLSEGIRRLKEFCAAL